MTVPVSCPYCNASVSLAGVPPTGRALCPRCGEAFPVRPSSGEETPPLSVASANGPPHELPRADSPPVQSLRPPVLLGLALGLVVLGVGLYLVFRNPGGGVTDPADTGPSKPAATVPPAALAGLAYLPPETNIAFAVQPGPVLARAEQTQTDPRAAFAGAGVPDRVLATLDRIGLKPEQIHHVAGGLTLAKDRPMKAVVALRLREPLADRTAFLKHLKATQTTAASGQVRYSVDLGGLAMVMTSPDPRTYLFALDPADLEPPARTGPPDAHLPAGLRESLGRLSPASFAWAATDADDWVANPGLKVLAALAKRPDLPARLAGVRALAVSVSLEPEPRLTASIRAADTDAAKMLQERMASAIAGQERLQLGTQDEWVTVEGPPAADAWTHLESLVPKSATI